MFNLYINAKLGDGCIRKGETNKYHQLSFSGTEETWIRYKHQLSETTTKFCNQEQSPNAYGKKRIYRFTTSPSPMAEYYSQITIIDLISQMTIKDLIALYFDDGSWHKGKHIMNLYTNSLTIEENERLILKIHELLGYSPKMIFDRKKDGRQYPYLYFPRMLVKEFIPHINEFINETGLVCFLYKIGLSEMTPSASA